LIAGARAAGRTALLETEARELLDASGVQMAKCVFLTSDADASKAIDVLGSGPLALKVVSKDVLHKSDAGGVMLNVSGAAAIKTAMADIIRNVRLHNPAASIDGILAAPMAQAGVELIIGIMRDAQFGPVILFGLGGLFVETLKDVVFRAVPIARADAEEMIGDIHFQGMLEGARGLPKVNRHAIIDLLLKVSALAAAFPAIAEIDINPVIAHDDGYTVADARIVLSGEPAV
jgi:acetyltransferase